MKKVDVYLESNIKGPVRRNGVAAYVMEYVGSRGKTYGRKGFVEAIEMTGHQASCYAAIRALKWLSDGNEIIIYTDDFWLAQCINSWIKEWKCRGWVTGKGDEVKHLEELKTIAARMDKNLITAEHGQHPLSLWMLNEIRNGRIGEDEHPSVYVAEGCGEG